MARVFVTRAVPPRVRDELEQFELVLFDSELPPSRAELLAGAAGCDGLVTMLTDRVDDELLDAAGPRLRVVANYAVGVDNIDLDATARRGVFVANTPDVLTQASAEFTIALILALLRRVAEGDRLIRQRRAWIWAPGFMLGRGLAGLTIAIVGFGRIGCEVGRLAEAFGMHVLPVRRGELAGALPRADVVSLHLPLSDETRHLIDARAIAAMKPTVVLVNTSRGPIVDEVALAAALGEGRIAGAALDVYEREPDIESALLGLDNVVLAPHLASATVAAREAMGLLVVEALRAVLLEDRPPPNVVSP